MKNDLTIGSFVESELDKIDKEIKKLSKELSSLYVKKRDITKTVLDPKFKGKYWKIYEPITRDICYMRIDSIWCSREDNSWYIDGQGFSYSYTDYEGWGSYSLEFRITVSLGMFEGYISDESNFEELTKEDFMTEFDKYLNLTKEDFYQYFENKQ